MAVFLDQSQTWKLADEVLYSLSSLSEEQNVEDVHGVLQTLLSKKALPDTSVFCELAMESDLRNFFLDQDLLHSCAEAGPQHVQLTSKGLKELIVWHRVSEGTRMACAPLETALADFTGLQLLSALEQKGWVSREAPKKSTRRVLFYEHETSPTETGRVWYYGAQRVSLKYLLCLCSAEDLFARHQLSRIPHLQPDYVYTQLLQGTHWENVQIPEDEDELAEYVGMLEGGVLPENESDGGSSSDVVVEAHPASAENGADIAEAQRALELLKAPGRWGAFSIKFSGTKGPHGSYEVSCPFHRRNESTGCKKIFSAPSADIPSLRRTLSLAKFWACQADKFDRQWKHVFTASTGSIPDEATLESLCLRDKPETKPMTDVDLDVADVPDTAPRRGKGASAKSQCAKPSASKAKAKAKAKSKPAPMAPVQQEPARAPSASSSSTSSSSSSSTSSSGNSSGHEGE